MACGNNKVTRDMVVSTGGLAVRDALQGVASKREALARLVGQTALAKTPVRWEAAERRSYFVGEDGSRTKKPDPDRHVHVVVAPDRDPRAVMVQITDRSDGRTAGSLDRRGHYDLVLFLQKPSESRLREAELSLAIALKRKPRGLR